MIFTIGFLRRFLFGLSIVGIENAWRDFPGSETETRKQLRLSSNSFISAYNTSLETGLSHILISELQAYDIGLRGFAYEGAGMGLTMIDYTGFDKESKFQKFVDENPKYKSLAHIGAGFVITVLNKDIEKSLAPMAPMERWWAMDGYGFYNGIFRWKQSVAKLIVPGKVSGYALRAFDRGVGRSIWFLFSGDINLIVNALQKFPQSRQADIWSGVGLASTYAGGVSEETLRNLRVAAGSYASYLSLGATQAANARYFANNIVEHNDLACSVHCGMSAESAAKLTIKVREGLKIDPQEKVFVEQPIFETYLETIRSQMIEVLVPA